MLDVTENHVISALAPLTISIGEYAQIDQVRDNVFLSIRDNETDIQLGKLNLLSIGHMESPDGKILLFRATGGEHACMPRLLQAWNQWRYARRSRRRVPGFSMAPDAVQQLLILYICPRPVILVSVDDGRNSNVFPMDLIGPVGSGAFLMALRNTSPSVATLCRARHAAFAYLYPDDFELAYRLGHHHKLARMDSYALPFLSRASTRFGLPLPASTPRVREVEITTWRDVGSHTLFVARIVVDEISEEAREFFHTSGIHREFRLRVGGAEPWLDVRRTS